MQLTHFDENGKAIMVDVTEYQPKRRSSAREEKDSYDVDFIDL